MTNRPGSPSCFSAPQLFQVLPCSIARRMRRRLGVEQGGSIVPAVSRRKVRRSEAWPSRWGGVGVGSLELGIVRSNQNLGCQFLLPRTKGCTMSLVSQDTPSIRLDVRNIIESPLKPKNYRQSSIDKDQRRNLSLDVAKKPVLNAETLGARMARPPAFFGRPIETSTLRLRVAFER